MESLREISRDETLAILAASGNDRNTIGTGLRSIFKVLMAHEVVFVDPKAANHCQQTWR